MSVTIFRILSFIVCASVLAGCLEGSSLQDPTAGDTTEQPFGDSRVHEFRLDFFHANKAALQAHDIINAPHYEGFLEPDEAGLYKVTVVYRRGGREQYMMIDRIRFSKLPDTSPSASRYVVTIDLGPASSDGQRFHYGYFSRQRAKGAWFAHGMPVTPRDVFDGPTFGTRDDLMDFATRVFSDDGVMHTIDVDGRSRDNPEHVKLMEQFHASVEQRRTSATENGSGVN